MRSINNTLSGFLCVCSGLYATPPISILDSKSDLLTAFSAVNDILQKAEVKRYKYQYIDAGYQNTEQIIEILIPWLEKVHKDKGYVFFNNTITGVMYEAEMRLLNAFMRYTKSEDNIDLLAAYNYYVAQLYNDDNLKHANGQQYVYLRRELVHRAQLITDFVARSKLNKSWSTAEPTHELFIELIDVTNPGRILYLPQGYIQERDKSFTEYLEAIGIEYSGQIGHSRLGDKHIPTVCSGQMSVQEVQEQTKAFLRKPLELILGLYYLHEQWKLWAKDINDHSMQDETSHKLLSALECIDFAEKQDEQIELYFKTLFNWFNTHVILKQRTVRKFDDKFKCFWATALGSHCGRAPLLQCDYTEFTNDKQDTYDTYVTLWVWQYIINHGSIAKVIKNMEDVEYVDPVMAYAISIYSTNGLYVPPYSGQPSCKNLWSLILIKHAHIEKLGSKALFMELLNRKLQAPAHSKVSRKGHYGYEFKVPGWGDCIYEHYYWIEDGNSSLFIHDSPLFNRCYDLLKSFSSMCSDPSYKPSDLQSIIDAKLDNCMEEPFYKYDKSYIMPGIIDWLTSIKCDSPAQEIKDSWAGIDLSGIVTEYKKLAQLDRAVIRGLEGTLNSELPSKIKVSPLAGVSPNIVYKYRDYTVETKPCTIEHWLQIAQNHDTYFSRYKLYYKHRNNLKKYGEAEGNDSKRENCDVFLELQGTVHNVQGKA